MVICGDFYSDLKVKVAGKMLSAHKFVLAARSDAWSLANLASTTQLDLSGEPSWGNSIFNSRQIVLIFQTVLCHFYRLITEFCFSFSVCVCVFFFFLDYLVDCKPEVAMAMLRWVYTDELELSEDDAFLIDLMKLANRFQLQVLRERSVHAVTLALLLRVTGSDTS